MDAFLDEPEATTISIHGILESDSVIQEQLVHAGHRERLERIALGS